MTTCSFVICSGVTKRWDVIHTYFAELSIAQRAFAKSLKEFKFVTIGSTQTDDERKIGWFFFLVLHYPF